MDFNNLNDNEVKQLIKRLKKPFNSVKFNNSLQEELSSMLNQVNFDEIVLDSEDVEYIVKIYRGRLDLERFSIHIRFKEFQHHLVRLDINPTQRHINPGTKEIIEGSHIHIYSSLNDKKDSIAIPLEKSDFPIVHEIIDAVEKFFKYNNIEK